MTSNRIKAAIRDQQHNAVSFVQDLKKWLEDAPNGTALLIEKSWAAEVNISKISRYSLKPGYHYSHDHLNLDQDNFSRQLSLRFDNLPEPTEDTV
jgi:hypothetical protein